MSSDNTSSNKRNNRTNNNVRKRKCSSRTSSHCGTSGIHDTFGTTAAPLNAHVSKADSLASKKHFVLRKPGIATGHTRTFAAIP